MTVDWLLEMGLCEEDCSFLRKKWEERELEHRDVVDKLRDELDGPLRVSGLVPGETRGAPPEDDPFLAGLFGL